MKQKNQIFAYLFAILLVAITGLAACSSTGIQRSEKTTTTMETMDNDINTAIMQLNETGASLEELTKSGQSNVKKAFDSYTSNVSKIVSLEKKFAKHAEEMQSKGKDYFDEWKKEGENYKNPQIQELSEQRRRELSEIYDLIAENSYGVKEAFKTYSSDVNEIQMYLSNDLTQKGVESIAPLSQRVSNDGNNLREAIKKVQIAINRARAEMVQSGK